MQRDWRFRGFIPKTDSGHARFQLFEIAEVLVMKMFADRTIGPMSTHKVASKCANRVVVETLLMFADAWAGSIGGMVENYENYNNRKELIQALFHQFNRDVSYGREIVWLPTGEIYLDGWQRILELDPSDLRLCGASIVLPVTGMASLLVKKAGRPLVSLAATSNPR
jgi:hypothetical protein